MRTLIIEQQTWPLREVFTISRGSSTVAVIVRVSISEHGFIGRGECVPYARYGETVAGVMTQIEALRNFIEQGGTCSALQERIGAGAARNALDCALWDLAAKQQGRRAWDLAGTTPPAPIPCAYTLSLDTAANMARAARAHRDKPLLKVKLNSEQPLVCIEAIREQAPEPQLIIDANESWNADLLADLLQPLQQLGVTLLEQPLAAGEDAALAELAHPIPIAADESCHRCADLPGIAGRYDVINIKLDKSGGLTEALRLKEQAIAMNLGIMVGCMIGTSLAMAPALLLTPGAVVVDLDGPLLLATDHEPGLDYSGQMVTAPSKDLWG